LWFRNLLIVFTANVLESGQRPGYELLSSFGTPMLGRLEHKIMFTELESSDVEPAIRFFLGKYLRRVVTEMMLEGRTAQPSEELIRQLGGEFDGATRTKRDSRTFRTLEDFVRYRLPERQLKAKFRRAEFGVSPADLSPEPWQPS